MINGWLTIAFLGGVAAAAAVTPEQVTVARDGRMYELSMTLELRAPPERVRAVLTDFEHLDRINPSIVSSEVLPSPAPDVTRVRTHLKSCVWLFCRRLEMVEDLHTGPDGDIHARIVAELSDMKAGSARWSIDGAGEFTRVSYRSTMEPGFWVPRLLRSRAVTRSLRKNLLATGANLERLAQRGGQTPAQSAPN